MTPNGRSRIWIWLAVWVLAIGLFVALYVLARETGAPTFDYHVR